MFYCKSCSYLIWREIRFHRSSGTSPDLHVGCLKWALVIWRCSVCSKFFWWKLGKAAPSFNLFLWFHSWICTCMSSCTTSIYMNHHESKTGRVTQSIFLSETGRLHELFELFPSKRQRWSTLATSAECRGRRFRFEAASHSQDSIMSTMQINSKAVFFLHHDQSPPYNPHWRFWLDCHRPYNRCFPLVFNS